MEIEVSGAMLEIEVSGAMHRRHLCIGDGRHFIISHEIISAHDCVYAT